MTSGTLTNMAGGTLRANYGTGGNRQIIGNVTNQGTILVETATVLDFQLGVSGGTFTHSGGTISGSGEFRVGGGTYQFNGGTVATTTVLRQSALHIGAGSTGSASFVIQGNSTLSGDVAAAQTILVQGSGVAGNAFLTSATGFTNAGNITLTSTFRDYAVWLSATSGTLTNAATGVITVNFDTGGPRVISAQLNNQGTVNVNAPVTLGRAGANDLNSGQFRINGVAINEVSATFTNAAGGTLTSTGTGALGPAAFANNGLLVVPNGILTLTGTFTNFSAGTLTGGIYMVVGTFKFTGANIVTNAAAIVLDGAASAIVNQSNGNALANFASNAAAGIFLIQNGRNLTTSGPFSNAGIAIAGSGSTFAATGSYTQTSGSTFLAAGTLAATVVNLDGGSLAGTGTVSAPIANNGGAISPGFTGAGLLGSGAATFSATSVYAVDLASSTTPGSGHDQLSVTGAVSLGGATLSATLGFAPAPGDNFVIINNDDVDAVAGTFAGLPQGAALLISGSRFHISYSGGDGNDVVLSANRMPGVVAPIPDIGVLEDAIDSVLSLAGTFSDPDGTVDPLTLSVVSNSNPTLVTATLAGTSLTLDYQPDRSGTATIVIRATDPGGFVAEDTFVVTVTAVNDVPSFLAGPSQTVNEDAGPQTVVGWATAVSAGPSEEAGQTLTFLVANDNPALFSAQPAVSPTGTLTWTSAPNAFGMATVTVRLMDNGGTAGGGSDTSAPQTFTITIVSRPEILTWTGAGADANWTTPANWQGGLGPMALDSLIFPTGVARLTNTNNFPAGTRFGSLTLSGSGYTLGGDALRLDEGLNATAAGANTVGFPITFGGFQTLTVGTGSQLTLAGNIAGDAELTKVGAGDLAFSGTVQVSTFAQTAGTVSFAIASQLLLQSTYVQTGGVTSFAGLVVVLSPGGRVNILGGRVVAGGPILGSVDNAGQIDVGGAGAIGALLIVGDYRQTSTGVLNIEVAGPALGMQHDLLIVAGTATLNGTLNLSLLGGYVPNPGNLFLPLLCFTRLGTFATINGLTISPTRAFLPLYLDLGLVMSAYTP